MTKFRVATLVLVVIASLSAAAFMPLQALPTLGQHRVLPGETLYCIGRGYGVAPWAIAQANGLAVLARLSVGQVLSIPAGTWPNMPPGPTCAPQFSASGQAAVPATATICVSTGNSVTYRVQRGDTLWRIATRHGLTVAALKQANGLNTNLIFVNQLLTLPGGAIAAACPTPAGANQPASTSSPSNPGNPGEPSATSFVPPAPTNTLAPDPTSLPPTATQTDGPSATPLPPTNTPIGPSPTPGGPTNTPGGPTNTPPVPTNTPPAGYPPPVTNTPPGYPS